MTQMTGGLSTSASSASSSSFRSSSMTSTFTSFSQRISYSSRKDHIYEEDEALKNKPGRFIKPEKKKEEAQEEVIKIQEGDFSAVHVYSIRTNVLCDTSRFLVDDICLPDGIQKGSFS